MNPLNHAHPDYEKDKGGNEESHPFDNQREKDEDGHTEERPEPRPMRPEWGRSDSLFRATTEDQHERE